MQKHFFKSKEPDISILDWQQIPSKKPIRFDDEGNILSILSGIGLPLVPGFYISSNFLKEGLQKTDKLDPFLQTLMNLDLNSEDAASEIKKIFEEFKTTSFTTAQFNKCLKKLDASSVQLKPSTPLPNKASIKSEENHEKWVPAKFKDILPVLKKIWSDYWNPSFINRIREEDMDPFEAMGGIILRKKMDLTLEGSISSINSQTGNPSEMVLTAKPLESNSEAECGSKYILTREDKEGPCKIKRISHAHLISSVKVPHLTLEQVQTLGVLTHNTETKLMRPVQVSWFLSHDHLYIHSVNKEYPKNYFPYREAQLNFQPSETQILKSNPKDSQWLLASDYPLTPMGMSLDYYIIQTINQGIQSCKIPLPLTIIRYVNGYRYRFDNNEKETTLLERLRKYFMKKNMAPLEKDFIEKYAPKYLELLKVVENQDLRDRPSMEERQLLDKTLRIVMQLIADTSEIRGLFILSDENHKDSDLKNNLGSLCEKSFFINEFQNFEKDLSHPKIQKALAECYPWEKLAPALLLQPNGEELIKKIQQFQMNYSYLWKGGDPLDPEAEEIFELMILYLRQTQNLPKPSSSSKSSSSLQMIHHLLFQGTKTFQIILSNLSEKLKKIELISNQNEIFMFTMEELVNILDPNKFRMEFQKGVHALIRERLRSHTNWRRLTPPNRLPITLKESPLSKTGSTKIQGKMFTQGNAQGFIRVIRHPRDFIELQPGEILVTPKIQESWLPLVKIAGGIIMDHEPTEPLVLKALNHFQIPTLVVHQDLSCWLTQGFQAIIHEESQSVELSEP